MQSTHWTQYIERQLQDSARILQKDMSTENGFVLHAVISARGTGSQSCSMLAALSPRGHALYL